MARKKVTEETVPGNELDRIPAEKPVRKARTVADAAEVYAKAKRADKAEAALAKLESKHAKMTEHVDSIKKQISSLKNLNAANYKNGFNKGYAKGAKDGEVDAFKRAMAALKRAL